MDTTDVKHVCLAKYLGDVWMWPARKVPGLTAQGGCSLWWWQFLWLVTWLSVLTFHFTEGLRPPSLSLVWTNVKSFRDIYTSSRPTLVNNLAIDQQLGVTALMHIAWCDWSNYSNTAHPIISLSPTVQNRQKKNQLPRNICRRKQTLFFRSNNRIWFHSIPPLTLSYSVTHSPFPLSSFTSLFRVGEEKK